MDLNDLRSLVTLFSFCFFITLAVWAWRPSRRVEDEQAEQLPLIGEAGFATPSHGGRHE